LEHRSSYERDEFKKFLNPSVVAKLSNMELRARTVVEGFIAGLHKSPYHGFSVEFAEHRQYMPGDDLKYLDWKVLGKTGRYYIKRYEQETNLKSYIIMDISRSMAFKSSISEPERTSARFFGKRKTAIQQKTSDISKLEYASYLAASLSYLMILQRDAVSLTTYDTSVRSFINPSSTKANLRMILKTLSTIKPEKETGTAACLNEIANRIKKRGLVIIMSDLFDDQKEVLNALKHFRYEKNEVILFQILDPLELTFLKGNPVTLKDMETNEEMYSQPFAVQKSYQEAMKEFVENYKNECLRNNIDYVLLSTDTSYDIALTNYLTKRKRLI
jgi:uncharacterized protein (DUF58 family)